MKVAHQRPFDCVLKTMIPGSIEGLDYQHGVLAAVGGGEIMIRKLDVGRNRLAPREFSLREVLWALCLVLSSQR
jgi:hypothetical protein